MLSDTTKMLHNKSDFYNKLLTIIIINLHKFPIISLCSRGETPLANGLNFPNFGLLYRRLSTYT